MARKASVRYWASRGGFCCWHKGKQVLLASGPDDAPNGPIYAAARKAFTELVFGKPEGLTLAELVPKYTAWVEDHREPDTALIRRQRLKPVCKSLGFLLVANLTAYQIEAWCEEQRRKEGWSDATVRMTLTSIEACLRWAEAKGVIPRNPVGKLEKPAEPSRGLECVLTPQEEGIVLDASKRSLREFIQVLRDTGARPGEISRAEAKHYDPQLRALIYQATARRGEKRHKTARSGKPRVIYLSGLAVEIVEKLAKRHPAGPLFRTSHPMKKGLHQGKKWAWTKHSIVMAFYRLRKKTKIKGLIAYSFRHTFAVQWLRAGKPIADLAEVMGTSIAMIQQHYGHLADQRDHLRRQVDDFHRPEAG